MTQYTGRQPKWEHTDCHVYFDIPGGGSGRIRVPARDEATALAAFHKNWTQIADQATWRYQRGELDNGQVSLDIALFDPSSVGK
jgi:hypothetical protein